MRRTSLISRLFPYTTLFRSKKSNYPIEDLEDYDLLFNRKALKNIGKPQFLGHIIVDKRTFDKKANAWYLDTGAGDRKSTRLNSSHVAISYAVFCLKKKKIAG